MVLSKAKLVNDSVESYRTDATEVFLKNHGSKAELRGEKALASFQSQKPLYGSVGSRRFKYGLRLVSSVQVITAPFSHPQN